MIASPKEMLTTWYNLWKDELAANRKKQAELQADEAKLIDLVLVCEKAFTTLFPVQEEPTNEPSPDGTSAGTSTSSN